MQFPINAATNISFYGDRYIHAHVTHQFSGETSSSFSLSARAHQFSSFILMVGRLGSPNLFLPESAIIIQNKGTH